MENWRHDDCLNGNWQCGEVYDGCMGFEEVCEELYIYVIAICLK